MRILITNATIVDEDRSFHGHLTICDDIIDGLFEDSDTPCGDYDECIDAAGCVVMPGVIDSHVHFREPGLTAKADMESESRAAAYGGVTTFFDMPNTVPQTVTWEAWQEKMRRAAQSSHVNYAFFIGATNDNTDILENADPHSLPGIKLFMGSSTGNMLVDSEESLQRLFSRATLPIMAHCEDTEMISQAMADAVRRYGDDPPVAMHPQIRSEEACWASSSKAVEMAERYGARLHLAHLSTAREIALLPVADDGKLPRITGEAVIAHLMFTDADYATKGALIKCNPAVKTVADREALRQAIADGTITTVATDHAPHRRSEKEGGCKKAASGMPMVQFSLPCMLQLVDENVLTLPQVVRLMCNNPARLFGVDRRGFLRKGYKADVVIVRPDSEWTVTEDIIQSRCGWSPLTGHTFRWQVEHTFCNGRHIFNQGCFDGSSRGEAVTFRHDDSDA